MIIKVRQKNSSIIVLSFWKIIIEVCEWNFLMAIYKPWKIKCILKNSWESENIFLRTSCLSKSRSTLAGSKVDLQSIEVTFPPPLLFRNKLKNVTYLTEIENELKIVIMQIFGSSLCFQFFWPSTWGFWCRGQISGRETQQCLNVSHGSRIGAGNKKKSSSLR